MPTLIALQYLVLSMCIKCIHVLWYVTYHELIADKARNQIVKRRFKEFVCLDAKLRHFHGSVCPILPSKRTFRTLDKSFVETRIKELNQYLQALISTPGVKDGQVLASFLSDLSDPTLFMPDTVGDIAGQCMCDLMSVGMLGVWCVSQHACKVLSILHSEKLEPTSTH